MLTRTCASNALAESGKRLGLRPVNIVSSNDLYHSEKSRQYFDIRR